MQKNNLFIIITGLVDNGKTTFVEFILKKKIAIYESGFITQNISVYKFLYKEKNLFLFDLPGHDLFDELKSNIINIADAIIIVISNENKETIDNFNSIFKITKKKNINLIICLNMFDNKSLFNNFLKYENTFYISAKNGFNVKKVIEKLLSLKKKELENYNYNGFIINSNIDNKKYITNLILLKGDLKVGDFLYFKNSFIKINNIFLNEINVKNLNSPSIFIVKNQEFPVELYFKINDFKNNLNNLNNIFFENNISTKKTNKELKIFIKTDSHNIAYSINNYINNNQLSKKLKIVKISIGKLSNTDLDFCLNFECILFCVGKFNKIDIKKKKIELLYFETIYEMINFVNLKYLNKNYSIVSKIIIKNIFEIKKNDKIAGCYILEGKLNINDLIKIYKNNEIVYDGYITTIKKEKKIVFDVNEKEYCGIYIKDYNNYEIGLIIESYKKNE